MDGNSTNKVGAKSDRIRVMLVDDHPAIREGIAAAIRSKLDLEVCSETGMADEALDMIKRVDPDVAVVDISLGDVHGLDLVYNIRTQFPKVQVLVFSMYDENVYAERALRAGAAGYLMKSEPLQGLVDAIRTVMRGEVYLSRDLASRILGKLVTRQTTGPTFATDELTDREMAVFQMLGEGFSIEEITERLHVSRKTVETYRRRAKEKLGLESIGELIQYAVQWTHGRMGNSHR
ncbi:MAG TPA: response regulator transcription factor [Rhodothermales bacterium]|nr:response regulator transcription factor [Rhodothermales bacterium]